MRPFRLFFTAAACFVLGFLFLLSLLQTPSENNEKQRTAFRSRWSFGAPASLFPPSAIISLTDDNTTFFLSRPALYGPLLPPDGLTGQLWVGAGFGDESLSRDGLVSVGDAELGCSDIPGWTAARAKDLLSPDGTNNAPKATATDNTSGNISPRSIESSDTEDDNTDNMLHHPLKGALILKSSKVRAESGTPGHADIQSIQESAEISGKVVLLSRGGCGFLEKTKWVQKRGGVALIVGDYTRGGHLIQMSAHDDTSNITIPSIFTAYTSAHLLSSLVPSRPRAGKNDADKGIKKSSTVEKAAFTSSATNAKATHHSDVPTHSKQPVRPKETETFQNKATSSWLQNLKHKLGLSWRDTSDEHIAAFDKADRLSISSTKVASAKSEKNTATQPITEPESLDDFVIGVHDWRDPWITAHKSETSSATTSQGTATTTPDAKPKFGTSRVPNSGIYEAIKKDAFGPEDSSIDTSEQPQDISKKKIAPHFVQDQEFRAEQQDSPAEREGLSTLR